MDKLRLKWQVVMESLYEHQRKHPISSILVKRIEIIQADVGRHLEMLTVQLNKAETELSQAESTIRERDRRIAQLQSEYEQEQEKSADLVTCINQLNSKFQEEVSRSSQGALQQLGEKMGVLKRKNLDYELRLAEAEGWKAKMGERIKGLGKENESLKNHLLHYRVKETDLAESLEQHTKASEQREALYEEVKRNGLKQLRRAEQLEGVVEEKERQLGEVQATYQHLVNDYNILKREYELLKESLTGQDETQEKICLNASLLREQECSSRIQLQRLEALDYSKLRGDAPKESFRDETFTIRDEELSEIGGPQDFQEILFRDEYKLSPERLFRPKLHQHATIKKSLNKHIDIISKDRSAECYTANQEESPEQLKETEGYVGSN